MLYVDDGLLESQDSEWLHVSLNVLVGLFLHIRLAANVAKSKTMMIQPGEIRSVMSEEEFVL